MRDADAQIIRATGVRSNLFDQLWIGENAAAPVVITDAGKYGAWARLPLMESVAAVLSGEALSYAVTAPELSEVTLFAACYGGDGQILAFAVPELSAPDSGIQRASGEISLASLFPPEAVAETRTVCLFLLNSGTWHPVCERWTGSLTA